MKKLFKLFIFFFFLLNIECKADTIPCIKIEFSALIESNFVRPLFISEKKIKYILDSAEQHRYESVKNVLANKEDFLKLNYNFVVTNSVTFWLITRYIKNQQKSFSELGTTKPGFLVTISPKIYFFVPYGPSDKFFDDMIIYLKLKHCDYNVIKAIANLRSYKYL